MDKVIRPLNNWGQAFAGSGRGPRGETGQREEKPVTGDRAEQRLRMCKGCGGLGSKMVSICMGLVREVNILSISDAVPAYLT